MINTYRSTFLTTLHERGMIHQLTDAVALDAAAQAKTPISGYIGFDATADSLHVGNLVGIMLLRRLQQAGHKPIVLMGGGTTKVGDPSGKSETRQLLSDEQINANIGSITETFKRFLRFDDSPTSAVVMNNDDWLASLNYIDFLREIGRHFTINRMLTMDSVRLRLEREQPLTFLEFNYMVMQGYDFVELHKRYGCVLQMGGSDQWGNILQGVELGRRVANAQLYGVTAPLIATADGAKMGKSVAGAVWLKAARLAPYDYWQFWRNTADADVGRFLRLFTDLPLAEITRLEQLKDAEINAAKEILATEATTLCHGADAAAQAAATASQAFAGRGGYGVAMGYNVAGAYGSSQAWEALQALAGSATAGLPTYHYEAGTERLIIDIIMALHMAASKGEAKRLIEQGGVKLNDVAVTSISATITATDLANGSARLSVGKKRHGLIEKLLIEKA